MLLVLFDLREVSVVGEVGGQATGHAVFHVEPHVAVAVVIDGAGRAVRSVVRPAIACGLISTFFESGGVSRPTIVAATDARNGAEPNCRG